MKSTDRVRYNYYSIDFACVSIEFITKSQCMDGKWIAFGHSEGSSYFYSRGYLKYLMVEYRLFPVFIIKIRICVQIVNTGIFAKLKGIFEHSSGCLIIGRGNNLFIIVYTFKNCLY